MIWRRNKLMSSKIELRTNSLTQSSLCMCLLALRAGPKVLNTVFSDLVVFGDSLSSGFLRPVDFVWRGRDILTKRTKVYNSLL